MPDCSVNLRMRRDAVLATAAVGVVAVALLAVLVVPGVLADPADR